MENILIGIVLLILYVLIINNNKQTRILQMIDSINDKLDLITENIEIAKSDIELKLESMEEDLVSDDVKIKNLVKMGFDEGDAREYVTYGTIGGH